MFYQLLSHYRVVRVFIHSRIRVYIESKYIYIYVIFS